SVCPDQSAVSYVFLRSKLHAGSIMAVLQNGPNMLWQYDFLNRLLRKTASNNYTMIQTLNSRTKSAYGLTLPISISQCSPGTDEMAAGGVAVSTVWPSCTEYANGWPENGSIGTGTS